ncbi:MAG: hypothetical protein AB4426_28250, partial [Xenococcaceae cyanobacterium]
MNIWFAQFVGLVNPRNSQMVICQKKLDAFALVQMYRQVEQPPMPPENFSLPFEGKLSPDNRWVIMANLIPWSE